MAGVSKERERRGLSVADLLLIQGPQQRVLTALLRGGELTVRQVAESAGIPLPDAASALGALVSRGEVQAVGDEEALLYRIRLASRRRRLPGWITWKLEEFVAVLSAAGRIALAIQVGGAALDYLVNLLLARWMGLQQFGLYTYQLGWSQLLATVAWLGLTQASSRFIPTYAAQKDWSKLRGWVDGGRAAVLTAGLLLALAALAVTSALARGRPPSAVALAGFALVPLLALVTLHQWLIRAARSSFWAYAPPALLFRLLLAAAAAAAHQVTGGLQALAALAATAVAAAGTLALQIPALSRILPRETWRAPRQYELPLWTRVGLPIFAVAVCQVAITQVDLVLLGLLRSPAEAGTYAAAMKVSEFAIFFHLGLVSAAAPLIVPVYRSGDRLELQRLLDSFGRVALVPHLVICGLIIALGLPLLGLYGSAFRAAYPAVVLLALGHLSNASTGPVTTLLMMTGRERSAARIFVVSTAAAVLLHAALIPRWGVEGAAWGTFLSAVLWNVWLATVARRTLRVRTCILHPATWR
jgi:O-antigen/teichoic acid export membrane protein